MIVRLVVFLAFLIAIDGCSLKKKSCYQQLSLKKTEKVSKVKGTIFFGMLPALFKASFDKGTSVKLFTPFGQKIGEIYSSKEEICLKFKGKTVCSPNQEQLIKELTNLDIPISVEGLITGRLNLGKPQKVYCEKDKTIAVYKNGLKVVYANGVVDTIFYKQFSVKYSYNRNKPKRIEIFQGGKKVLKIILTEIE